MKKLLVLLFLASSFYAYGQEEKTAKKSKWGMQVMQTIGYGAISASDEIDVMGVSYSASVNVKYYLNCVYLSAGYTNSNFNFSQHNGRMHFQSYKIPLTIGTNVIFGEILPNSIVSLNVELGPHIRKVYRIKTKEEGDIIPRSSDNISFGLTTILGAKLKMTTSSYLNLGVAADIDFNKTKIKDYSNFKLGNAGFFFGIGFIF